MTVASSTIVGALACQKNSFLKTLSTLVVSCSEYEKGYAVELKDTVLFPEGGGQPYDTGKMVLPDDKEVVVEKVLRNKLTALHITQTPVEAGTPVSLKVDWDRRIDLMQQHTGQHLISAVFDTYDLETLSWSMGEVVNYIELPRKVEPELVEEVSKKINDLILENVPITVTTPDSHGGEVDVSHIPSDYDLSKGIVRVVKIGDIDANPCCGTHLQATGQIQAVTLLHQTPVRGGHSRLHFVCGSRVYKYLAKEHGILRAIQGTYLSCQLDEVVEKVEALTTNYKKATSRETNLLKELAAIEASRVFNLFKNGTTTAYVHRADSVEYITLLQKELLTLINNNKEAGVDLSSKHTVVLVNGDKGKSGMVKILGPAAPDILAELKTRLSNLKGGGKGASFQGKITKFEKGELDAVLAYLNRLA